MQARSDLKIQEKTSVKKFNHAMIFADKDHFPVEIVYKDKKYVLFLTRNGKLMLQKAFNQ